MNNHALILNGVILTQLRTQLLYYEILVLFTGKVISKYRLNVLARISQQ